MLKVDIEDKVYVLVNIYAPNKDKVTCKFFQSLHNTLQSEDLDCEENIICGGDFNCPLNPMLDKRSGVMVPRKMVIDNIECLKTELDLVHFWRNKNPQTKSYTCIKMIDMVKALRLAWLKRIFNDNESTWKTYLLYLLKDFGGSLIFECNYTMKDLSIISIFYRELLQWWSEFREILVIYHLES